MQDFENIKSWMYAKETHEFCNAFSLVMICRVTDEGDLLDNNGKELTSINDVVDDIASISTLNEKAKLITIQAYPGINFIFTLLPPTKLLEGNIFNHICLSTTGRGVHLYRALVSSVQGLSSPHANDIWWPRLDTC